MIRSTEPATIRATTPSKRMALANPPSTSIFQVPNAKRGSVAYLRAVAYAMADSPIATAWELMCQPSASSAIELYHQPAVISITIMAAVIHMTMRVLRSAVSVLSWKTWPCVQPDRFSVCMLVPCYRHIRTQRDAWLGASRPLALSPLLDVGSLGDAVEQPVLVVVQHGELALDRHRVQRVLHGLAALHLDHAFRPAGQAEGAGQRNGAQQEMGLLFTWFQRHHETLDALGLLVESKLCLVERRQHAIVLDAGLRRSQHRPGHHVAALRQRREWAIGTVHARPGAHGHGRAQLRARRSGDQQCQHGKRLLHGWAPGHAVNVRASFRSIFLYPGLCKRLEGLSGT